MAFTPLKAILPAAVRRAGVELSVGAAHVTGEAEKALARLWPPEKAAYVQVISFVGGLLKVSVRSPSAAHGLRLIGDAWIREINQALGKKLVQKVEVRREGF